MNDESFISSSPEKTTFAFLSAFVTAREDKGAGSSSKLYKILFDELQRLVNSLVNDESFISSSPEKTTFAFISAFVTAREDKGISKGYSISSEKYGSLSKLYKILFDELQRLVNSLVNDESFISSSPEK